MGKNAANKKMTTIADDDVQRRLADLEPKSQFLDLALNMSWQLAITVIVPIFIGVKLDAHFKTSPSFTILGFFFAILFAALVVKRTLLQVNSAEAEVEKEEKKAKEPKK